MNKRLAAIVNILLCAALIIIIIPISTRQTAPASALAANDGSVPATSASGVIIITEVMSSNRSAVPSEDGAYYDYIELYNSSPSNISLDNFFLTDDPAQPGKSSLAGITVPASGYVTIYCSGLNRTGHAGFKLSSGETVALFSASSEMLDAITIEVMPSNHAMTLDASGAWAVSPLYTPSLANTEANHQAYLKSFDAIGTTTVHLNEAVAKNLSTYRAEDGSAPDWIELYNSGAFDVDISGWTLTDDETNPACFRFPDGTLLKAGEYKLILCDDEDLPTYSPAHANFSISTGGEIVTLYNNKRQAVDRLTIPPLDDDCSYGRAMDGQYTVFLQPTPLFPNDASGVSTLTQQMMDANTSGLLITEAMSANGGTLTVSNTTPDWVEVTNTSAQPVDLSGYGLSDSIKRLGVFKFPSYILEPGKSVVVYADEQGASQANAQEGAFYAGFNISASGDVLALSSPGGVLVDKLMLPALRNDISYGRAASDGSLFYYYDQPTPGQPNRGGYEGVAQVPAPSTPSGVYNGSSAFAVSFDVPEGTTLYYTTNGSAPSSASQKYNGDIQISSTTVIRAAAYRDGYLPSDNASFSYIVNENHTLPIVSLAADPDGLYNPQTGMLANGPNYATTDSNGYHYKANYWLDIEIPVSIEYFNESGERALSQNAGIQVSGATTREQAQKSFQIVARNTYGSNRLMFDPFPGRDYAEFKSVVLRNTGQDYYRARMRDALLSSFMEGTGVYYQDSQPVILYLNGEYYGQYYLREKINRYSLAQFEGITDQSVIDSADILSGSGKSKSQIVYGSFDEYQELVSYVKSHDLKNQEALDYVLSQVDVENLFDYISFQIIIGNSDPSNIKFYKFDTPGSKWKWAIYDLDWAYNTGNNGAAYNSFDRMLKPSGIGRNNTDSTILLGLLKNPDMEQLFLERFAKIFLENFDPDTVHAKINELHDTLAPEMQRQFDTWAGLEQYSGSVTKWETEVQYLHNYIDNCRTYLLQYCKSWFGLSEGEMRALFGSVYDGLSY